MVHAPTLDAQRENFEKNREKIFNSGHRYAIITVNEIEYYNTKEEIYKDYPALNPNAGITFGTHPKFVDIGKETNSLEYRIEKNEEEIKECNDYLKKINKEKDKLEKERKKLMKEILRNNLQIMAKARKAI